MVGSDVAVVFFGLATALSWGAGDFSGGMAAKGAGVFRVAAAAHGIGLVALTLLALFAEPLPPVTSLLWGAAAGLSGAVGLAGLYRALATGQMGIAAPVAAVVGSATPVLIGALLEGPPALLQFTGFTLAIAGIGLVSRTDGLTGRPAGLGLAVLAGIGIGGFTTLINQAGADAVFWPLVAARLASFSLMLLAAWQWNPGERLAGRPLPLALLAGTLDALGNIFFVLATQAGRLDISAVLSSVSTMVTILLARVVLQERLSRTQAAGVIVVLAAIPLIAA